MSRKDHKVKEYEIRSGSAVYYRLSKWDADMKADEERRLNPSAVVTVKLVKNEL